MARANSSQQPDGSYELTAPCSADAIHPFVDPEHETGSFVRGIARSAPGKTYLGYSVLMSFGEYMKLWGELNSVSASFKEVDLETFIESTGRLWGEMFAYSGEFGYDGDHLKSFPAKNVSCI
jgi:hypothetical protein